MSGPFTKQVMEEKQEMLASVVSYPKNCEGLNM